MISRKIAAAIAGSLILSSSVAVAQSAQPLSLANSPAVRASAESPDSSELRGTSLYVLGAIVLGLVVWGAIELLNNDDDNPSSP